MSTVNVPAMALLLFAGSFGVSYYLLPDGDFLGLFSPAAETQTQCEGSGCVREWRETGHANSTRGDGSSAIRYYRRAALQGDPESMFHLAYLYDMAQRDQTKSSPPVDAPVRQYTDHNQRDMPRGDQLVALISAYDGMTDQIPNDSLKQRTLAFIWYRAAAEHGFAPAYVNLGVMAAIGAFNGQKLVSGAGVNFGKAAKLGNPFGIYFLTRINSCGATSNWDGVTQPNPTDLAEPTFARTGTGTVAEGRENTVKLTVRAMMLETMRDKTAVKDLEKELNSMGPFERAALFSSLSGPKSAVNCDAPK